MFRHRLISNIQPFIYFIDVKDYLNHILGSNITFFWSNTTDSDGHNVNYAGHEGQSAVFYHDNQKYNYTAEQFYEFCLINSTKPKYDSSTPSIPDGTEMPSKYPFVAAAENPNKVFTLNETGWHYFYCGRPYHCLKGGVKAKIYVFENHVKECPFHPNC